MRIMYILRSFAVKAGTERVISDKMNYLSDRGYDISMVTYEQGSHPHAFPLNHSIHYHHINAPFFTLSKYPLWKRVLKMRGMRRRFREGFQQAIDKEQPDVIIATTYSMKLLDIVLKAKTGACRLLESHVACFTIRKTYDYRHHPLMRRVAALYDKVAFMRIKKFDCVVTLTEGDAHDWGLHSKNVVVIPNPVTAYPETVLPHDGSGRRIICVGRLNEQKCFDMLIEAFSLISEKCRDWHVVIFGTGEDEHMLRGKIHQHQLEGRINIQRPTDLIYDEYMKSEFYVLSSRYEGYPLVLNEAMSCGIPCVAFRCNYGPADAISHGVNGLLAENGNIEDLSQKMLWMIEHPTERLAMGREAREAARRYLPSVILEKWNQLFRKLTQGEA